MSNIMITASLCYEEPVDYSNIAKGFNESLIKSGIGKKEENVNDLNCTYAKIPRREEHFKRQKFLNDLMECKLDYEIYKDDTKILDLMKEKKLNAFCEKIENKKIAVIYGNKQIKYAMSLDRDNNNLKFHLIYKDEQLTSDNSKRICSYRRRLFDFLNGKFSSKEDAIIKSRYIDKVTGDYFKLTGVEYKEHIGYLHNEKMWKIELGNYQYKEDIV